jgi:dethiobiotin synthetase
VKGLFVTGTDTGVGKTVVCGLLGRFLRERGFRVVTQKWVQTGAERPEDLAEHGRLMGLPDVLRGSELRDRCPYRFSYPASPHLAAAREGAVIDPHVIAAAYGRLAADHDVVLVEGTGGFLVPLAEGVLAGDLVGDLGIAALLVVGNRLGCINHALLTVEAIRRRAVPLEGLVFNRPPAPGGEAPEEIRTDNLRAVGTISGVPVLGELPHMDDPASGAAAFEPLGGAFLARWRPT